MREYFFWSWLLGFSFLVPSDVHSQWTATGGPYGYFIRAFAAGGGSLYLADDLGIYQSLDRGETWQGIGPAFGSDDYRNGGSGYPWGMVARHDTLIVAGDMGIRVRAGSGAEWKASNAGLGNNIILNALVDAPEGLVALSWLGGVYRSADGGANWGNLNLGMETPNTAYLAMDGDVLYATMKKGLYRSRDQGRSWDRCAPFTAGGDSGVSQVACLHPYVFANHDGVSVFRSADSGSHWERIDSGIHRDSSVYPESWGLYVAGSRVYLTWGGKLFISADSGKSWGGGSAIPYSGYQVLESGIYAVGSDLFASSYQGVFRSRDQGATWGEANQGIACCSTAPLANAGPGRLLATTEYGQYVTSDFGTHWGYLPTQPYPLGSQCPSIGLGGQVLSLVPAFGLFRSRDGGRSWEKSQPVLPKGIDPIMLPLENELYYSDKPDVFLRSADTGQSWSRVPGWDKLSPRMMAICDGIPYAVVGHPQYTWGDTLFRFDQGSQAWVAARTGMLGVDVVTMGAKGRILLMGTQANGLLGSADSGRTFSPVAAGSRDWGAILCMLSVDGDAYVGTDSGVAISKAGTDAWQLSNAGLLPSQPGIPARRIYSLHAQDGFLFATTLTGIWKLPIDMGGTAIRAGDRLQARKPLARWIPVSGGIGFRGAPDSPLRAADGKLSRPIRR
jgi:photosystem II stability/assembly factor-like uncharacterized protein